MSQNSRRRSPTTRSSAAEAAKRAKGRKGKAASAPDQVVNDFGDLRAASQPGKDGMLYGISQDGVIFSFDTRNRDGRARWASPRWPRRLTRPSASWIPPASTCITSPARTAVPGIVERS